MFTQAPESRDCCALLSFFYQKYCFVSASLPHKTAYFLRVCFFFLNQANGANQANQLEKKYIVQSLDCFDHMTACKQRRTSISGGVSLLQTKRTGQTKPHGLRMWTHFVLGISEQSKQKCKQTEQAKMLVHRCLHAVTLSKQPKIRTMWWFLYCKPRERGKPSHTVCTCERISF